MSSDDTDARIAYANYTTKTRKISIVYWIKDTAEAALLQALTQQAAGHPPAMADTDTPAATATAKAGLGLR